jgi:peptidoglycan lytic transglycosylase
MVPGAHQSARGTAFPAGATDADTRSQSTKQPRTHRNQTSSAHRRGHNNRRFSGRASFYSYRGGKTASGATFNPNGLTGAHRTLPFGTRLQVTDVRTGKDVRVVVTDRGPAPKSRVLDLSLGAAGALHVGDRGVIQVRAEVVGSPGTVMR